MSCSARYPEFRCTIMGEAMYEDLIELASKAVDRSLQWAQIGWPVTFGRKGKEVSSLQGAQELPENDIYREEALDYWSNVELLGQDAAAYGRKSISFLEKGELKAAESLIYQALYTERPCARYSTTWGIVHDSVVKVLAE